MPPSSKPHRTPRTAVDRRSRSRPAVPSPRASVDAWGQHRPTQKVTKYRIVACACGQSFIAHDGRMKTCEACKAHTQHLRNTRRTAEAKRLPTTCTQCGQSLTAQRRTQLYCSRACQQQAEARERGKRSSISGKSGSLLAMNKIES